MRELLRSKCRGRTLHTKEWLRCSKLVSKMRRPSSASSLVISVTNQMHRYQRRGCKVSLIVGKTIVHMQIKVVARRDRRIVARIIQMHAWYVLTLRVKRGATGWIAGIATGS